MLSGQPKCFSAYPQIRFFWGVTSAPEGLFRAKPLRCGGRGGCAREARRDAPGSVWVLLSGSGGLGLKQFRQIAAVIANDAREDFLGHIIPCDSREARDGVARDVTRRCHHAVADPGPLMWVVGLGVEDEPQLGHEPADLRLLALGVVGCDPCRPVLSDA